MPLAVMPWRAAVPPALSAGPVVDGRVNRVSFDAFMETIIRGFEVAGVAVLVLGSLAAFVHATASLRTVDASEAYQLVRRNVGRAILLGLELLIIADIVLTVTVDTTLRSALSLGVIVLVRTFLSFSLEVELEGAFPWKKRSTRQAPRASGG